MEIKVLLAVGGQILVHGFVVFVLLTAVFCLAWRMTGMCERPESMNLAKRLQAVVCGVILWFFLIESFVYAANCLKSGSVPPWRISLTGFNHWFLGTVVVLLGTLFFAASRFYVVAWRPFRRIAQSVHPQLGEAALDERIKEVHRLRQRFPPLLDLFCIRLERRIRSMLAQKGSPG